MATSKIESLGLAKRIEELISSGVRSSPAISTALKTEGFNVSQPTVSRWLKHVRETRSDATQKIIADHVEKTVPADLAALEKMEAQCLTWAHEEDDAFACRLAEQKIDEHLQVWLEKIQGVDRALYADAKEHLAARRLAVREFMTLCLLWIADDIAMQKKRIGAMRQATTIIDLKLRYSGVIGAGDTGHIYLVGQDEVEKDPQNGRLLVFKGGKLDAK
jgi:hypothetical protein